MGSRALLVCAVLVAAAHALLLANPGYFNHDELEFLCRARPEPDLLAGLADWGRLFFRPLGHWVFGRVVLWSGDVAYAAHAVAVLWHCVNAILVGALAGRIFGARAAPWAALAFGWSAFTSWSVGWIAGVYDLGVVTASASVFLLMLRNRWESAALDWIGGAVLTAVTLGFKESAIGLLPVLAFTIVFGRRGETDRAARRVAIAGSVTVLAYLVVRIACGWLTTVSERGDGYGADIGNAFANVWLYAVFPFAVTAHTPMTTAREFVVIAALLAAVGWLVWARIAILARGRLWVWLSAAVISVCPMAFLPKVEGQYFYVFGMVWAIGLSRVATMESVWLRRAAVATCALLALHAVRIDWFVYREGVAVHSMWPGFHAAFGGGDVVSIELQEGSREWTARRIAIVGESMRPPREVRWGGAGARYRLTRDNRLDSR